MFPFATSDDVQAAWRPLTPDQENAAEYWCAAAARRIRRRWPDIDARVTDQRVDIADVRDIVVALVIRVLGAIDNPVGARSFQAASGSESRQVTLAGEARVELPDFDPWMLDILDAQTGTGATPVGAFPRAGRYDALSEWKECER